MYSLTIFFVSYALAEPATNVLLKRFTPRVFFTAIILTWGLCMTFMGLVHNKQGLYAARWFLGLTEAGLYPVRWSTRFPVFTDNFQGVNYYLSCWYKRSELGLRAATFFSAAALAGSFGGLLAAAIAKMNGVAGKGGWAWIFIIEGKLSQLLSLSANISGVATIIVSLFCWWMVFDWPDTARFLTPDERIRVRRRLAEDKQASTDEQYDRRHIFSALKDWKTWLYAFTYMGTLCPLYSFSLFLPTIVAGMGYKGTQAQVRLPTPNFIV